MRFTFLMLVWGVFFIADTVNADVSSDAEVVWVVHSVSDDGARVYNILYSKLFDDQWSAETTVYSSNFPLVTPSVFSRADGSKIVAWSELQSTRTVIKFTEKSNSTWNEASLLSDIGVENLGVSLLEDSAGTLRAFWAAHQNDNDDIYQSHFDGSTWSAATRVHPKNLVADYGVSSSLNGDGDITLSWKSFSATLNRYQIAEKKIIVSNKKASHPILLSDSRVISEPEKTFSDIVAPTFLPRGALHVIHIPGNLYNKNFKVNDR